MMRFPGRTLAGAALLACACSSSPAPSAAYFPPGTFESTPEDEAFVVSWYSKHLAALREPSLAAMAGNPEAHAYRFLWLRSFDAPIAVRVDVSRDGSGTMTVKATSGRGGYEPGILVTNRRRVMPRAEVSQFLSRLGAARFWQLSTRETIVDEDGTITVNADGAQWIVEGVRSGRYQVVDRWSPRRGAYRDAALSLVERSGLAIDRRRVY